MFEAAAPCMNQLLIACHGMQHVEWQLVTAWTNLDNLVAGSGGKLSCFGEPPNAVPSFWPAHVKATQYTRVFPPL